MELRVNINSVLNKERGPSVIDLWRCKTTLETLLKMSEVFMLTYCTFAGLVG